MDVISRRSENGSIRHHKYKFCIDWTLIHLTQDLARLKTENSQDPFWIVLGSLKTQTMKAFGLSIQIPDSYWLWVVQLAIWQILFPHKNYSRNSPTHTSYNLLSYTRVSPDEGSFHQKVRSEIHDCQQPRYVFLWPKVKCIWLKVTLFILVERLKRDRMFAYAACEYSLSRVTDKTRKKILLEMIFFDTSLVC